MHRKGRLLSKILHDFEGGIRGPVIEHSQFVGLVGLVQKTGQLPLQEFGPFVGRYRDRDVHAHRRSLIAATVRNSLREGKSISANAARAACNFSAIGIATGA
jgi:hypothetical protein